MGVAEYVRALLASDKLGPQVRHHRCEPARAAVYAESRLPWPAAIRRTLEERGLSGLYSHQALATDHIRAGHSVVVATPTASGSLKPISTLISGWVRSMASVSARALAALGCVDTAAVILARPLSAKASRAPCSRSRPLAPLTS